MMYRRWALNLRRKMLLGYGVAFAVIALVVVWATVRLSELGRATDQILRQNYRSIDASWMMRDALHRQNESLLMEASARPAPPGMFVSAQADFLYWLGKARDNVTVEGEDSVVSLIDGGYRRYLDSCSVFRIASIDSTSTVSFLSTVAPISSAVDSALFGLQELNRETMYQASRRAMDLAARGAGSTLVIGGIGLAAGIFFSILLSGRILRPLYQTIPAARRLASGDYSIRVPEGGRDELGTLAREFNIMAGQLERFESLHVDRLISEKSKTEAILNGIDDGIIHVDPDLRVQEMNPTAVSMLGAARSGQARKPHLSELLHTQALIDEALNVAGGLEPSVMVEEERTFSLERDGRTRYLLFTAIPLEHSGRILPGCVVVLRDVTRMREMDKLKSEFVMAAAHELRTPVTSIGMSIDLLADHCLETLEPRERDLLDSAREEVQRLRALVNDLLDLSRIEAGRIDLEPEAVQAGIIFDRIAAIFDSQLGRKNASLEIRPEGRSLEVLADPGKIAWVLTNIVSNAIRYIPEQAGRIILTAERMRDNIQLSVSDNGPGIPLDHQTRIFQKFVQFDTDGRAGGSGLGLAICREIIRASGGTIWVESEPGCGSTFVFTLPVPGTAVGG